MTHRPPELRRFKELSPEEQAVVHMWFALGLTVRCWHGGGAYCLDLPPIAENWRALGHPWHSFYYELPRDDGTPSDQHP